MVATLFPPGSYYLKAERIREPEKYTMSQTVPGRINSIVNIHNPSIEFYPVDRGLNTGVIVILAAGGGHNTLTVGSEAADFLPFFYNYGVNTIISYSTKDQEFADRLYADLQARGVRCWFATHDIQGGRKLHEQIDEAIRTYDKLLLILSEASTNSNWVKTEIANARARPSM